MSKKYIIAGLVVVAVIGAVAAVFMLKPSKNDENFVPDETMQNMADSMGITVDELEEKLNTPLTEEEESELEAINREVESIMLPEIVEITDDDNPDDDIYNFVDKDGNTGTIEMPENTMSDEQIDIWNQQYEEWLAALARGEDPGPPPSSYNENTVILGNPSDPGDNGGEIIIYDTAPDESGIDYEMVDPEYTGETPSDVVDPNNPFSNTYKPSENPNLDDGVTHEDIINDLKDKGITIGGVGD